MTQCEMIISKKKIVQHHRAYLQIVSLTIALPFLYLVHLCKARERDVSTENSAGALRPTFLILPLDIATRFINTPQIEEGGVVNTQFCREETINYLM